MNPPLWGGVFQYNRRVNINTTGAYDFELGDKYGDDA